MTIAVRLDSGTPHPITVAKFRAPGGLKTIVLGQQRTASGLQAFYQVLGMTLSTDSVLGRGNSAATVLVTSSAVTATPQGTVGTVSHNWTRTDGGSHAWTIDDPTGAATTFSTMLDQSEEETATFVDTVTDQAGQSITSAPVTADCANIYYGGGYRGGVPPAPGTSYP